MDMDVVRVLKPKSFLAVPLKAKGKTIGVMAVDNYHTGAKLTEADVNLVSTLAGQVAIAIENARLYDELELRVKERTTELSEANAQLKQEIIERRRIESELQEAKRFAEDANRAKSDFLANMSHELRTPMNSVIGFSEMILDGIYGEISPEILEVVGEIQKSGEHLLGLINDVLDISKIEAGQMELRLSQNLIQECVETVVGRLASLAKDKGLKLTTRIQNELPSFTFDFQRITQVLMNLVSNAVKFAHEGHIEIGVQRNGQDLLLWVLDTGIGIPDKQKKSIFNEFQQVDSSISRERQGSGLGLAIAKRFVEMHGGTIWVESKIGQGSTFRFTLPMRGKRET
jgi:signal transduction histidine kinase